MSPASTMRAGVVLPHGDHEVVYVTDHPVPEPGPTDVRVRVQYAALNRNDLGVVAQRASMSAAAVIGADGAGVVDAVGDGVDDVAVGSPVVLQPTIDWGDDDDRPDDGMHLLGHPSPGTHAEFVVVPAANVRPLPAGWSVADAAAIPLAGLTAWRALVRLGRVRAGERVLITGASGGVSSLLIPLARDLGASVYVTTSTPARLEDARAIGAVGGVLHGDPDWPTRLRDLAGGGLDLAVDSAGVLQPVLESLVVGGRLVTLGRTVERHPAIDLGGLFLRFLQILGTTMGSGRDFDALLAHLAGVTWRPMIDGVWPLEDYASAIERLRKPHAGKILLEIPEPA